MKGPKQKDLHERFMEKIFVTNGCWIWTHGKNHDEPVIAVKTERGWRNISATIYILNKNGIEADITAKIIRTCGKRDCVNPHHLKVSTELEYGVTSIIQNQERFWSKVEKTSSCWLWVGCKSKLGYGRMTCGGKVWLAHHLSLLFVGINVPKGMHTDHLCRTPACINPSHLEVVTPKVNSQRGMAGQYRKNLYSKPNCPKCLTAYVWIKTEKTNRRVCKTCARNRYSNKKLGEVVHQKLKDDDL